MSEGREYEGIDFSVHINDLDSPFEAKAGGWGNTATVMATDIEENGEINDGDACMSIIVERNEDGVEGWTQVFMDAEEFREMAEFVLSSYDGEEDGYGKGGFGDGGFGE